MKKIVLNSDELREYNNKIIKVISTFTSGTYYFKDFFKGQATSPRIARRFYEDVRDKNFTKVTLVGKLSREGYVIS